MLYTSTRGAKGMVPGALAIKSGIAPDGGLYVPVHIPVLRLADIHKMCDMGYNTIALTILKLFLTDYTEEELATAVAGAYGDNKFEEDIVSLNVVNNNLGILELWHGPTCAFKDIALQLLPHLMKLAIAKTVEKRKMVFLVATSGDTGKAALEGFRNVPGADIIVFYPVEGVSAIQKQQMVTTAGDNVKVFGVKGNFDDCQRSVKEIFGDVKYKESLSERGFVLNSANSINWGRLVPQIVYYFSAYCDAVRKGSIKLGDLVNFAVPSANFGDIMAGYYAKKMGLPVYKLICASNSNNVLTDFFENGCYDTKREFFRTISPSMDILVSSNLERLLYMAAHRNAYEVVTYMQELKENGSFRIPEAMLNTINLDFYAGWADEAKTVEQIQLMYMVNNYLVDTHTAVALSALKDYQSENIMDNHFSVVLSTASGFKFSQAVLRGLDKDFDCHGDEVVAMERLHEKTGIKIPKRLVEVTDQPVLHNEVIEMGEMRDRIEKFLLRQD